MFVAVFVAIIALGLTVVLSLHGYLWFRLVVSTTRRGTRARHVGNATMVVLPILLVAALLGTRIVPIAVGRPLAWPGYLWLALLFYLMLSLLVAEIGLAPVRLISRFRSGRPSPIDESRRLLLGRSAAVVAGVVSGGALGFGLPQALGAPVVRRVTVRLGKLPSHGDGLRIALVSDIHLGPMLGSSHIDQIVSTINGLEPDVVAIVGDLVDGSVPELGPAAAGLRHLKARLGRFFVTGNHEYYSGYQEWITKLSDMGIRVLRNERVEFEAFDLAGVNDAAGDQNRDAPDYERALGGRDRSRPVVLLAHHPSQAYQAARYGVDLQLSGHTHGGQMWPFKYAVAAEEPVVAGLGTVAGVPVYVTRGAGFWGPPIRVGAPPEIALITLRRQ